MLDSFMAKIEGSVVDNNELLSDSDKLELH